MREPFLLPVLALVLGIFTTHYFKFDFEQYLLVIGGVLSLVFCYFKFSRSLGIFSLFLVLGIFRYQIHHHKPIVPTGEKLWKISIDKDLSDTNNFYKYQAKTRGFIGLDSSFQKRECKLLFYLNKSESPLTVGDRVWVKEKLSGFQDPQIYTSFDYGKFMETKQIYYQVFASKVLQKEHHSSFFSSIDSIHQTISKNLKESRLSKQNIALIESLILGNRTHLSDKVSDMFRKLGVYHLLALSGFHTGFVFGIFIVLFYPIRFFRYGKEISLILSFFTVVLYAIFTGLSPSVVRATLMLGIFVVGSVLQRIQLSYHLLLLSAFFMVWVNPHYLLDIGFQLSYLAVFSILWFWDVLKGFSLGSFFLFKWVAGTIRVSLAAQLGVSPLIIYYFGNFSLWFFISNLMFVPYVFVLIVCGFLLIIDVGFINTYLISVLNDTTDKVFFVAQKMSSVSFMHWEGLYFSTFSLMVLYIGLVFIPKAIHDLKTKRSFRVFYLSFGFLFLFQLSRFYTLIEAISRTETWVLSNRYNKCVLFKSKEKAFVFYNENIHLENLKRYTLYDYKRKNKIQRFIEIPMEK